MISPEFINNALLSMSEFQIRTLGSNMIYSYEVSSEDLDKLCANLAHLIEVKCNPKIAELEAKVFVYETFIKSAGFKLLKVEEENEKTLGVG